MSSVSAESVSSRKKKFLQDMGKQLKHLGQREGSMNWGMRPCAAGWRTATSVFVTSVSPPKRTRPAGVMLLFPRTLCFQLPSSSDQSRNQNAALGSGESFSAPRSFPSLRAPVRAHTRILTLGTGPHLATAVLVKRKILHSWFNSL